MAVKFKDYYEVLDVPRTATEDDIRKAYRKLARKHHPDVNPGDQSAEDKFKDINEAYEVLSDPEKRKQYDELGANWKAGSDFTPPTGTTRNGPTGFGNGDFGDGFRGARSANDFSDFFESLFGRSRGARAGAGFRSGAGFTTAGQDIEAELPLTLEEAHRGGRRSISLEVAEPCPDCGRTGSKNGKTCPTCHGAGVINQPKTFEANIPAGVRDGSVIRLAGQGERGASGAPPGDLYLHVRIEPHPLFEVIGDDDVQIELPLAPWEAALGAKIRVATLDGAVDMTIPAGTQGGARLRLRRQGINKRGGGRGDEYVKLKIVIPPKLSPEEKELFEKLAGESSFNPRELMPGGR